MSKLQKLKDTLIKKDSIENLPLLAHCCYCILELGNSYKPTVEQLDDLYAGLVSGIVFNLGSGKVPEVLEDFGPEDKHSEDCYRNLWFCLTMELGFSVYPSEQWFEDHPESDEWADLIERGLALEIEYFSDPEKWLIAFRQKISSKN